MKIIIEEIGNGSEEELILRCHELTPEMMSLVQKIKTRHNGLVGVRDDEIHKLSFDEIYYFEVVDNKSFFYCGEDVYESKLKLYEFEKLCRETSFFRASKSTVLNSEKIEYIKPSLSGRFEATLINGEKVIVSRQYVSRLKELMGL